MQEASRGKIRPKTYLSSQDLKDKLEDVIEMLKNRAPHSDILDYLKAKDRDPLG